MNFFSSFPTKLIELVMPHAFGGSYDLMAQKPGVGSLSSESL